MPRSRPAHVVFTHHAFVAIAIVGMATLFAAIEPTNRDPRALLEVLRIASVNGILAAGMTLLLAAGGIDLSVGSVVALSATAAAAGVSAFAAAGIDARAAWLPSIVAAAVGLLTGAVCGAANGLVVVRGGIPPFLATLAALLVWRGAVYDWLGSSSKSGIPLVARALGGSPVGAALTAGATLATCSFLLAGTTWGRSLLAIGGNAEAARLAGIAVGRVKFTAYVASGALAALAGLVLAGRTGVVVNTDGDGYELDAIAATVIGGTSLHGGRASMMGTALGAVLLGVVRFGLQSIQAPAGTQKIASGVVILVPALLDALRRPRP